MDAKTRAYIAKMEGRLAELHHQLAEAKVNMQAAESRLEELVSLSEGGTRAHREDIDELAAYRRENARLIEGLQKIADGRGKYAQLAKETLGYE